MNLIFFSIKTKGLCNFARRLWTVFARFGFSETRMRRALYTLIDPLFTALGFTYESNEAIVHDVIDLDNLSATQRSGYGKSLALFRALPCNSYTLRPHFEGEISC